MRATRLPRPGAVRSARCRTAVTEVLREHVDAAASWPDSAVPSFTHALRMRCCSRSVTSAVGSSRRATHACDTYACDHDHPTLMLRVCLTMRRDEAKHVVVDGSNIATEGRTRAEPCAARRSRARVPRGIPVRNGHRRRRRDVRSSHRCEGRAALRRSRRSTASWSRRRPARSVAATRSCSQIADRRTPTCSRTTRSRSSTASTRGCSTRVGLIGGKPVTGVGWVFVLRRPVRGPTSRDRGRDAAPRPPKKTAKAPQDARCDRRPKRQGHEGRDRRPRAARGDTPGRPRMPQPVAAPAPQRASAPAEPINEQMRVRLVRRRPSRRHHVDGRRRSLLVARRVRPCRRRAVLRAARERSGIHHRAARARYSLSARRRPFVVQRFDPARRGIDVVPDGCGPPSPKAAAMPPRRSHRRPVTRNRRRGGARVTCSQEGCA